MNTRESLNPQSDLKTDATHSVLESVISGLIEPRQDAPESYKPTLISNRPGGLTIMMKSAMRSRTAIPSTSPSPSSLLMPYSVCSRTSAVIMPMRPISQQTDHVDEESFQRPTRFLGTASPTADGRRGRPRVGRLRLFSISRSRAAVPSQRIRILAPHAQRHPILRPVRRQSNLTGAALNTQREWNLKVSSLANGELVAQVRDEIDSQIADSKPLTEEWIKQYEEDSRSTRRHGATF